MNSTPAQIIHHFRLTLPREARTVKPDHLWLISIHPDATHFHFDGQNYTPISQEEIDEAIKLARRAKGKHLHLIHVDLNTNTLQYRTLWARGSGIRSTYSFEITDDTITFQRTSSAICA